MVKDEHLTLDIQRTKRQNNRRKKKHEKKLDIEIMRCKKSKSTMEITFDIQSKKSDNDSSLTISAIQFYFTLLSVLLV